MQKFMQYAYYDKYASCVDVLLKNVWLGVTAEHQAAADERIPHLLRTPAAVRFVSCEPMIGPVSFSDYALKVNGRYPFANLQEKYRTKHINCLDWIICGGESGPGARPMNPEWARSLRDQCQAAGVPYFFKQWGAFCAVKCYDFDEEQRTGGDSLDGRKWHGWPKIEREQGQ